MIDTVKFKIPIDDEAYESIKLLAHVHIGYIPGIRVVNYFVTKTRIDLGSHSYFRQITVPREFISGSENFMFLELSIPKYVYNHNVKMIKASDFQNIMLNLHEELRNHRIRADLKDWEIMRLDLCYSWKMSSSEDLNNALNILQNLRYSRKKRYNYDTSVMFKGSAYTVKFYSKYEEFLKHDYNRIWKQDDGLADEILLLAENILRFEVTIRKTHFITVFRKKSIGVYDITEDVVLDTMNFYFKKLIKLVDVDVSNKISVYDKLIVTFGEVKGRDIYEKYRLCISKDPTDQKAFNSYSYSNRYKFYEHLKKANVGLETENSDYEFNLTIPSENAVY